MSISNTVKRFAVAVVATFAAFALVAADISVSGAQETQGSSGNNTPAMQGQTSNPRQGSPRRGSRRGTRGQSTSSGTSGEMTTPGTATDADATTGAQTTPGTPSTSNNTSTPDANATATTGVQQTPGTASGGTSSGGEQTDLSGTYTGNVNFPDHGMTGESTLTITGNKFTLTSP